MKFELMMGDTPLQLRRIIRMHRDEITRLSGDLRTAATRCAGAATPGQSNTSVAAVTPRPAREPTYFEFQVETQVHLADDSPPIPYPEQLRASRTRGDVMAQFIVDTTGRADTTTLRILSASHAAFIHAVRAGLGQLHFVPATLHGTKVRQLVENRYEFKP